MTRRRIRLAVALTSLAAGMLVGCGDSGPPLLDTSDAVEAHCGSGDTPSGGCRCNAYCQNTKCGLCNNGVRAAIAEPPAQGFTPCDAGFAGSFPCFRVDLLSFLPLSAMGGGSGNDIWGWTDPLDGTEYAIVGRSSGTAFVSLADPQHPVYLGNLPTHTVNSLWRDAKVYANHAYIVSEASAHGMQVFDLTQLRSVANPPVTFSETAHYGGFGNAHNLATDEDTAYAYAVGTSTCSGGPHIVDISNPTQPTFAGCVAGDGYTHDTECVVYAGPDATYGNHEICFSSNEDTLTVVDVTDKTLPVQLSRTSYSGRGYTHQAWLTDDQRYLLLDDELDEQNNGHNTRTYVWDVTDLNAPFVIGRYNSRVAAIDHNLYIDRGFAFQANYRAGLRILDIGEVASADLREVGFFDIYPADDIAAFNGAWSNYPFFASGVVIVSGIEQGLFVLRPDVATGQPTATVPPTATPTATRSLTQTRTRTSTRSPTSTPTVTATRTSSPTRSRTPTRSTTPTRSQTRTFTPTLTRTPTSSPTVSRTATPSRSPTRSPTVTITRTPSRTRTATRTPTITATRPPTRTFTPTRSPTVSPTAQPTRTASPTRTRTKTATVALTRTFTPTRSPTRTGTATRTRTSTPTRQPTRTPTPTITRTSTRTPTRTRTPTPSRTATG